MIPVELIHIEYTPVERRILTKLGDGKKHSQSELKLCLWDEMAKEAIVAQHIWNIRKKIQFSRYRIHGEQTTEAFVYQLLTAFVPAPQ